MKLAFFGASVTEQKEGYWFHFARFMRTKPNKKGYGGQHLCDAGICRIKEVTDIKPDLCIIDWFSTGFKDIDNKTKLYIDTIINKFSVINCKLIFMFFPREDHDSRKDFYDFCKKHLDSRGVIYIDINDHINYSAKICRDSVHTTPFGSVKYAKIMLEEFKRMEKHIKVIQDTKKTIYSNIKSLKIEKRIDKFISLKGKGKIITFALIVGKGNGFVEINGRKIQTWDRWCHYDRLNCKINDIDINGEIKINILDDQFDYSTCTDKSVNFNKEKKYLTINEIFYTGELEVTKYV